MIAGVDGNDVLDGDAGSDVLQGGAGNDTFIFAAAFGNDVIADFEIGADVIVYFAIGAERRPDRAFKSTEVGG